MYIFQHEDKQFTPDGTVSVPDTDTTNKQTEANEIEWLKTHPDKVFLYVKHPNAGPDKAILASDHGWQIQTWLGTSVATHVELGDRAYTGFGFRHHTYRRSVRCRIFGRLYTGWYMESSGDYCRLKRSTAKAR